MNFQRRQKNRSRRGFTLMELLLVMAILVVMASMVGFAFLNMQKGAQEDATRSQISTLRTACQQYSVHVGRFPNELEDLINKPAQNAGSNWRGPYLDLDTLPGGQIRDTWGNEYQYEPNNETSRVSIVSNGKDGQPNTADDIPPPQEVNRQQ